MYIYHLIKTEQFHEAARWVAVDQLINIDYSCVSTILRKCHDFLGPSDRQRWEDVMYSFMEHGQLPVLI